jgi:hypothetical protein
MKKKEIMIIIKGRERYNNNVNHKSGGKSNDSSYEEEGNKL